MFLAYIFLLRCVCSHVPLHARACIFSCVNSLLIVHACYNACVRGSSTVCARIHAVFRGYTTSTECVCGCFLLHEYILHCVCMSVLIHVRVAVRLCARAALLYCAVHHLHWLRVPVLLRAVNSVLFEHAYSNVCAHSTRVVLLRPTYSFPWLLFGFLLLPAAHVSAQPAALVQDAMDLLFFPLTRNTVPTSLFHIVVLCWNITFFPLFVKSFIVQWCI